MVERSITSTPDLSMASFNLRSFFDTLRKNSTKMAQQINRALDLTPGARARFQAEVDSMSTLFKTIEMPLTDVGGFRRYAFVGGLGQMLSTIMLSDSGRALFQQSVLQGRGRLSPNLVALIANVARRELQGAPSPAQQALVPREAVSVPSQ